MLAVTVERPVVIETTALGAAMLAGVGCGMFGDLESAQAMWQADRRFEPSLGDAERRARQDAWARAIEQVVAGLEAR